MTTTRTARTELLNRGEGKVAFDVRGSGSSGPLILLVPGMGDLRSSYRHVVAPLVDDGYRVATMDLRGHGDSDVTFTSYGDQETADDIAALIRHLGGPAVVVGNSMAAGAAVLLADQNPQLVDALVLIGPFVRDSSTAVQRLLMRVMMAPAWAAASWKSYIPRLYAGRTADDHDEHLERVIASLRRPGYAKAFSLTTRARHHEAEQSLSRVRARSLILMGEQDPDFPDPQAEATWIAAQLNATVRMIPEAGHYPQGQQPALVATAIHDFLTAG